MFLNHRANLRFIAPIILSVLISGGIVRAEPLKPEVAAMLDSYNVSWNVPGPTAMESMPIGNGDIGLNVWTEPNGDVSFYIGKSDSLGEKSWETKGLMKVGGFRLSMNPSKLPSGAPFVQLLKLRESEILITEGTGGDALQIRVWVDANHPVIRVEAKSDSPVSYKVSLINWRLNPQDNGNITADTILEGQTNRIAWYHRNGPNGDEPMRGLTFGAVISGPGLVSSSKTVLESAEAKTSQLISVYPLTAKTATPQAWLQQLDGKIAEINELNLEQTRSEHVAWWSEFWNRSWVFVSGDKAATDVTRGYVLQRFITACAGRGTYPVHFNGSFFTVDNPKFNRGPDLPPGVDPDYRDWGAHFWMQNTRPIYWPMLASGDFDMMQPFFKMYAGMIPLNTEQTKRYWGHDGAYIAEENYPWGGIHNHSATDPAGFTTHYYTPILELSTMMLDYYEYTGDAKFAREILVPTASAGLLFFDQHFGRDAEGRILVEPSNAIEMYWKVRNPATDVAGLHSVLPRMIALPDEIVSSVQREKWREMLARLPLLPMGVKKGSKVLLPYEGPQTAQRHNDENPELYAIYPFQLYGIGKPDLKLANDSFSLRLVNDRKGSWFQDVIQAAMLGRTQDAKEGAHYNSLFVEPGHKFPAFWNGMNSYVPGQENGGNLQNALQKMVVQANGKKILLLPAWPKEWSAEFKLHAPFGTIVEGSIKDGRLSNLVVTPPERAADVIDLSSLSSQRPTGYSIVSPYDTISPLKATIAGAANVLATVGDLTSAEGVHAVTNACDGNASTKYFSKAAGGAGIPGVDSGFIVTPRLGQTIVNGFQFAAAGDLPESDPLTITIEGSNAANSNQAGGNGFVLLYQGPTGLLSADRGGWGLYGNFANTKPYRTYRVLITSTSGGSVSKGVQFGEFKLFGEPTSPLAGENVVSQADTAIGLKATVQGGANVLAESGKDFSSSEGAANIKDRRTNTKYYNNSQEGSNRRGVDTGFVITLARGPTIINGIQFATGNDVPARDPMYITIEGSNASNALEAGASSFTPIWEGPTGLIPNPGRSSWGKVVSFFNSTAYRSYRVLITETAGTDGAQYSEIRLMMPPQAPTAMVQPSVNVVRQGDNATFSVDTTGTQLNYQWRRNEVDLPGANSSLLQLNGVVSGDDGKYRCIVGNAGGLTAISNAASLIVQQTFGQWAGDAGLGEGVSPRADPDGDGITNVFEFFHHLNPIVASTDEDRESVSFFEMEGDPGELNYATLTYRRSIRAAANYGFEGSKDLQSWTKVVPEVVEDLGREELTGDVRERAKFLIHSEDDMRFYRISLEP